MLIILGVRAQLEESAFSLISVNNTVADVALGWRVDLFSFIRNLKPICIVIAYLFTGTCVGVCEHLYTGAGGSQRLKKLSLLGSFCTSFFETCSLT